MSGQQPGLAARLLSFTAIFSCLRPQEIPMIELNPIRARIADLTGRLDALRGYL